MPLLELLDKLITEHGSSSIMRDHIALLREEAASIEKKLVACQRRCAELQGENAHLRKDLERYSASDDFVEFRGALFKRKGPDDYDPTVRCPSCQMPISSLEQMLPYHCSGCNVTLDFTGADLPSVLRELRAENP